jgi:hypothetical protein
MDATVAAPEVWSTQNKQFHLAICKFANVTLIDGMLEKALDHWDRLRTLYIKDVLQVRITEAQQEHHALVAAFRTRDPDRRQLLRTHNQRWQPISVLRHGYVSTKEENADGCIITLQTGLHRRDPARCCAARSPASRRFCCPSPRWRDRLARL